MNRSAKGFRIISGIFVLLNLVAFFLPVTKRIQENYVTIGWSQMDYAGNMLDKCLPHGKETIVHNITSIQIVWILGLMILPLLLVLITGIWGIVGNYKQIVSSILSFVVLACYVGMVTFLEILWPEAINGQVYERGIACTLHLVFSGCSVVAAIVSILLTPKKIETTQKGIPQVEEIRQQQVEAKYSVIVDEPKKEQPQLGIPPYVPGNPRGVMVGLTGLYAGAEIPFANGEYIKLGRLATNDLVFEGQPKVSRNHCRIKWDAGRKKYVFCDYSSNGSFVNGSEDCLPQNLEMEMEPGTVVLIGDNTNTFRLE